MFWDNNKEVTKIEPIKEDFITRVCEVPFEIIGLKSGEEVEVTYADGSTQRYSSMEEALRDNQ